jgi:hypothetical protein
MPLAARDWVALDAPGTQAFMHLCLSLAGTKGWMSILSTYYSTQHLAVAR